MFHAIAIAVLTSTLLFVLTPRMPSYHITSLHIQSISLPYASPFSSSSSSSSSTSSSSYSWSTLSTTVSAGFQIENQNFLGADLYSIVVDIYYPDVNGILQPIGILRESNDDDTIYSSNTTATTTTTTTSESDDDADINHEYIEYKSMQTFKNNHHHRNTTLSKHSSQQQQQQQKQQSSHEQRKRSDKMKPSPFLSIQPRSIIRSPSNLVSINLTIPSSTYSQILKDLWNSTTSTTATSNEYRDDRYNNNVHNKGNIIGTIDIWVSGAAHIKSPTILGGIPLTISLMCANTLNLFLHQWQWNQIWSSNSNRSSSSSSSQKMASGEIVGRSCRITNIIPGWVRPLEQMAIEVKEEALRRYENMGQLFDYKEVIHTPSLVEQSMIESLRYIHLNDGVVDDGNVGSNLTLTEIIASWNDF